MRVVAASLVSGLLFGIGLGVSGMTRPDKVIGFLDLVDGWDPSLALVLIGAIAVHLVLFRLIVRRSSPLFAGKFGIPSRTDLDARLVLGSALFGVGWALGGYCPGPGLVSGASLAADGLIFLAALTAGMLLFHLSDEAWAGLVARRAAEASSGSDSSGESVLKIAS